ncbi:MutS protein msh4 [Dimargaris xerosporica]|nr:MutS protein msh4 [Dimargaris xerosporica]
MERRHFSAANGKDAIATYGLAPLHQSLLAIAESKYYCLAAVGALFQYLENQHLLTMADHTVAMSFESFQDAATAYNLELVASTQRGSRNTLFGVLNHTLTPMGARLLRKTIMQPLTDTSAIQDRYDLVDAMKDIKDLDALVIKIIT